MRMPPSALTAVAVLLALLPLRAPADEGGGHVVRFDRPMKAGDRFGVRSSVSRTQEMLSTPDGRKARTTGQRSATEIEAAVDVLEVDKAGGLAKVRVVVARGSVAMPNGTVEPLEAGDVFFVETVKRRRFVTREGRPLTPAMSAMIAAALPTDEMTGGPETERLFGAPRPQAVGATWAIDAKRTAARLRDAGIEIPAGGLTGGVKLAEVGTLDGRPCVKVLVKLRADHMKLTEMFGAPLPDGFEPADGTLDTLYTGVFPADPAGRIMKWSDTTRVTASFKIAPGRRRAGGSADLAIRGKRTIELFDLPTPGTPGDAAAGAPQVVELDPAPNP
jgi:hypothetical protein